MIEVISIISLALNTVADTTVFKGSYLRVEKQA